MYLRSVEGPRTVTLPDGSVMTRADLPPNDTVRWVASRKATVVKGVASGLVSKDWAMHNYELSEEELDSWMEAYSNHGNMALRATAIQQFRQPKVE